MPLMCLGLLLTRRNSQNGIVLRLSYREIYRQENAHRGQVTAIAASAEGEVVITGGEDGSVKAWKIHFG
jgi:hypothetical protein